MRKNVRKQATVTTICRICQKPFQQGDRKNKRETCARGGRCPDAPGKRVRMKRAPGERTPCKHRYTCEWCGVEYTAKAKCLDRFCGKPCYYKWYHATKVPPPPKLTVIDVCPLCGDEYEVKNKQQWLCPSEACHKEINRLKAMTIDNKVRKQRTRCVDCGASLGIVGYTHNNKRFCDACKAAKDKAYTQTEAFRQGKARQNHVRRARKRGVAHERVTPREIFQRDGWRCQQCHKKVRPDFNRFHPRFPNLDHIVPLARGGPHVRENLQCLCRECNCYKRDTGEGQMLLIG